MFETGIISAPTQILETPTTLFLLSPRHLQFFNSKKSSVLPFESPVFKALICSQYVFAASRSHVVKIDMTDVGCMETYAYDIDITNIALFKSRLVVVQDMFVNIQGKQEECFDHSVVAVDATDNCLFVVLSDGSLYKYTSRFDYLRKIKSAFDVKAGNLLFVANDKTKIDVLDLDGRSIKRIKAPGVVLKIVLGDPSRQDASSDHETKSALGPSLSVLIGISGAREIVFYNSKYSVTSRLGCIDCFSSGHNIYVRMSHCEYDVLCVGELKPFIRNIDKVYKHEYYTIGTSGKNMYLLRNEAILNSVELEEEIIDIVVVKDNSKMNPGDCEAKNEQSSIFVVSPKSIAKVADLPSLGLVHVMDVEFVYGIWGFFSVVSINHQVLLFDLSTEEVLEKMNEELLQGAESPVQRRNMQEAEDDADSKIQQTTNEQRSKMRSERVYRKIVFSGDFYKLRDDGVLFVEDERFVGVSDFMVADKKLFLLSRDDLRIYRIERHEDEHTRKPGEAVGREGHADVKASINESTTSNVEKGAAAEDGDTAGDRIPEPQNAPDSGAQRAKDQCSNNHLQPKCKFTLIANMPVQYERYAFGTSTLFLCSKSSVIAVGDNVVHKQECAESVYTYRYGDGFVVLKKGSRFAIYEESEFVKSEVSRMRAVNLSHDDFNFKAFVEREEMLENLEKGADRLSVRAEEYASAARRVRDKTRKKKYWFF